MISRLISNDRPGHRVASTLVLLLLLALVFAPFVFPGTRPTAVASRIAIFVVVAASYDLLLGYTGIVSFAHAMFFAIGAYAVAIPLAGGWIGWTAIFAGAASGVAVSAVLSAAIALLSLRVQKIFFSMITLAVASFAQILVTQTRDLTGGSDGLTFSLPASLGPSFRVLADPVFGVRVDGRLILYYFILVVCIGLFLFLLRVVNSPFGRVLQAIRENEFRAEALGYPTILYRTLASVVAAVVASLAGSLLALLLRYVGPDGTMSFTVMTDILLMVVIGGMGTLYGPALGAAVIVLAEYYLQTVLQGLANLTASVPLLPALFQPDRWLLWLGLLFVAIVYFFPAGIVGTLRRR